MDNKKYIYRVSVAQKLINNGIRCIDTGFNAKCQKFYWVFPFYEYKGYMMQNSEQIEN